MFVLGSAILLWDLSICFGPVIAARAPYASSSGVCLPWPQWGRRWVSMVRHTSAPPDLRTIGGPTRAKGDVMPDLTARQIVGLVIDLDRLCHLLRSEWEIVDRNTGSTIDLHDPESVASMILPILECEMEKMQDEIDRRGKEEV